MAKHRLLTNYANTDNVRFLTTHGELCTTGDDSSYGFPYIIASVNRRIDCGSSFNPSEV